MRTGQNDKITVRGVMDLIGAVNLKVIIDPYIEPVFQLLWCQLNRQFNKRIYVASEVLHWSITSKIAKLK